LRFHWPLKVADVGDILLLLVTSSSLGPDFLRIEGNLPCVNALNTEFVFALPIMHRAPLGAR
jgi:hypothetical protein